MFHVHQKCWCYPQGLTSTTRSPNSSFFPHGYLPAPTLVCSRRRYRINKLWKPKPPVLVFRSSGFVHSGNNGPFRYSQYKKKKEGRWCRCQRRKRFQCSCFLGGCTWLSLQPNWRLRLVRFIGTEGMRKVW